VGSYRRNTPIARPYSSDGIDPTAAWRRIGAGGWLMIKKVKDGYKVVSEKSGKNLGGPYKTREEAQKRLRQVEFFKHNK
jgi:hypothetical protein